jgi:DNA-directed RNA polymerase specialized sigma subunit
LTVAQRELANTHVRLVQHIAERVAPYARRLLSKAELVSVGYAALIDAAESFASASGVSFETYASRRIGTAIGIALRKEWEGRK